MGSLTSSDDIFRKHQLPPVLSKMDETARVQIAYACETRGVLESESKIAEHAYRKMVLVTKTYQLRLLTAQRKLLEFDEELSALINAAVLDLETFLGGEEHGNVAPVRTARKLLIVPSTNWLASFNLAQVTQRRKYVFHHRHHHNGRHTSFDSERGKG